LGALSVKAPDNDDSQGARAASAAIGIVLEPSQPGIISVRPFINYSYLWWITGAFLSAHSEGHITVTAVTEADGNVLDHRDLMLWSQTTKSDGYGDSADGIAWPPNVEVKFVADPAPGTSPSSERPYRGTNLGSGASWYFPLGASSVRTWI